MRKPMTCSGVSSVPVASDCRGESSIPVASDCLQVSHEPEALSIRIIVILALEKFLVRLSLTVFYSYIKGVLIKFPHAGSDYHQ